MSRPLLWHSVNTLIAVVNEIAAYTLALYRVVGTESEPIQHRLEIIQEVLPSLLNLRNQSIPDDVDVSEPATVDRPMQLDPGIVTGDAGVSSQLHT